MADVFMYADETGNLDYHGVPDKLNGGGASSYFGFGTAVFPGSHGEHLLDALHLRAQLEGRGINLPKGFHAYNDSPRIRSDVFNLIKDQAPRFDVTFLCKNNAYDRVKQRGEMYLYQMALAGPHELIHGERESFIGGCRPQHSGLGVGSQAMSAGGGGCSCASNR